MRSSGAQAEPAHQTWERGLLGAVVLGMGLLGWIEVARGGNWDARVPVSWSVPYFLLASCSWWFLVAAMMVPVLVPWIWAFSTFSSPREGLLSRGLAFLSGYLLVWIGYGLVAAGLEWFLHELTRSLAWREGVAGSLLLIGMGLYQATRARLACLEHCRSPVGFFLTSWRPGRRGAVMMGLQHGLYCLGCCWALMLLGLAAGAMNLLWMAALTLFVLADHAFLSSPWPGRVSALALVLWGMLRLAG